MSRADASAGSLLGPNEVVVIADVVERDEQALFADWAEAQRLDGRLLDNPQDQGAYSTPYQSADGQRSRFTKGGRETQGERSQEFVWIPGGDRPVAPLPEAFWRVRSRIVDALDLMALEEDCYKGSFLTWSRPGAQVHQHRDALVIVDDEPCDVLRCNVLFQRPETGGLPVIASSTIDVPDRGAWAFFPTQLVHSATTIGGSAFRGTLSFGFLVRPADLWARCFRLAGTVRTQYELDGSDEMRRLFVTRLRDSAALGSGRLDLIEYIVLANGPISVNDAAFALEQSAATVSSALIELQRAGFVESLSAAAPARGTVLVP